MKFLIALILIMCALGVAALARTLMIPVRKSDYVPPRDEERALAEQERTTADCTFEKCSGCGICQTLDAENVLAATRTLGGGVR